MAGTSRALSWIAIVFGVLTLAAAIWAVLDLVRTGNPTLLASLVPLVFVNLLLLAVLSSKKRRENR